MNCYLAPEPGAKKFVEAIKKAARINDNDCRSNETMNHVPSPSDGTVKSLVNDGQSVELSAIDTKLIKMFKSFDCNREIQLEL